MRPWNENLCQELAEVFEGRSSDEWEQRLIAEGVPYCKVAENIDQVIEQLDEIIEVARSEESRLGYFPALFCKVTIQVKKGIEEDFFEDGARMERLDVVFANRYLDTLAQYRQGMADFIEEANYSYQLRPLIGESE